ncbi:MAG: peptidoglycan DD-metalloendopeptidase family protein [Bacteroidales bacterium]|nr:peptidoglycan DD-metalloendopeptidase family protein [Bacteroidales bacterium]
MKKYIFFILFVFGALTVMSQSQSDKLKNDKKKIEAEIKNTQKLLAETQKNKNASLQELSVLKKQISNREALITAMNNEIIALEEELVLNEQLLKNLDKKLQYMKADYAHVVYVAFKNRRVSDKITFLLSSDNFSQMFRRAKYYRMFANNVKIQVELINKTQEEIKQKNAAIIALKEEKSALLAGKEKEVKSLEKDRNAKSQAAEALKKKEKNLSAELKKQQARRKELDAAIKRAIEAEIKAANEKKKREAEAKKSTSGSNSGSSSSSSSGSSSSSNKTELILTPEEKVLNNSFVSNKGKLPWPVAKGAKILDYGNHPHPDVPSVMIDNKGIDILVEAGTPVRAIFNGEVTGILNVGDTKVLMIRHGEYLSVYQNLATISVKKGDKVTTKQTIGTVSKSISSTYELHFEIWKNSTPQNPNSWLMSR